ncbi:uncharacterized protein STEHIDRAFT_160215 [Stereum hirsutum FP-91666 SS1]|uniref:uncharacterized protein n=1 Tax=Stereum hirsutum (strain FP-91666) TaxID=721885 RepID=UPI000444A7DA|nr:uncharacterized protein STEHIDRAFT_160215 [Stereum hirsutum FP-91666 SS1]EIM83640.1 hypothetical protein STEHIDRAFT_160215 [Stereum hirsutum FP-91666 SS1]
MSPDKLELLLKDEVSRSPKFQRIDSEEHQTLEHSDITEPATGRVSTIQEYTTVTLQPPPIPFEGIISQARKVLHGGPGIHLCHESHPLKRPLTPPFSPSSDNMSESTQSEHRKERLC